MWGCWSRAAKLDLALEPLGPERRGQLGQEDLQGHRAVVLEVLRQEDRGHAPAPELALERVAVAQGVAERRHGVGQKLPVEDDRQICTGSAAEASGGNERHGELPTTETPRHRDTQLMLFLWCLSPCLRASVVAVLRVSLPDCSMFAVMTDRLRAALADRYRIERELGQGGMATVYLAEDLKHHRKVAVKVLRPELAAIARRRPVPPRDRDRRPAPASRTSCRCSIPARPTASSTT